MMMIGCHQQHIIICLFVLNLNLLKILVVRIPVATITKLKMMIGSVKITTVNGVRLDPVVGLLALAHGI